MSQAGGGQLGVVTREIENKFTAVRCVFVGKMSSYTQTSVGMFGQIYGTTNFTDCNLSFNCTNYNVPNNFLGAIAWKLTSSLHLVRCKIFDSFLQGQATVGLLVGTIEGNGKLFLKDTWSTGCRVENRDNKDYIAAFVVGRNEGEINAANCSFQGILTAANQRASQLVTAGSGKLTTDNVTFDLSGVHYQCYYHSDLYKGSVTITTGKACQFEASEVKGYAKCEDNTQKWGVMSKIALNCYYLTKNEIQRGLRFVFGVDNDALNFGWDGSYDTKINRTAQVFKPGTDYEFQDIELTGPMNVLVKTPGLLIISGFTSFGFSNTYKKCTVNFDFV